MQLDLFFPPFDYSVLIPELGVPLLTAVARKAGHRVRQADLNQEFLQTHLGDLRSYEPLLARRQPPWPTDAAAITNDRRALLEFIGAGLVSIDGAAHELAGSPLAHVRRQERLIDKSCHLASSQLRSDWSTQVDEEAPRLLGELARQGGRELGFRRDLLRLLHHLYFTPTSYGVDAVAGAARRDDDLLWPFYARLLDRWYGDTEAQLVGISIWSTPQLIPALMLARAVRQRLPRAHLVAGGAWCTYAQDRIPATRELFSFFDSFVVHEGTDALLALCHRVEAGQDGRDLAGIVTAHHPPHEPIAIRPPPAFDDTEPADYDGFDIGAYPHAKLALRLHRGCYWARCTFCTHACHPYTQRHSFGKNTRLSSSFLSKVATHVRHVGSRYGISDFTLSDNLVSPAIMLQLCELNSQHDLRMTWDSLARFEPEYTADFCRQLAHGGCRRLDLGLETASNEGLKRIGKGIDLDLVLDNLGQLKAAGIGTKVFVVHYGGQPAEEYEKTLHFLVQHREIIDEVAISRFAVARNSNAHRTSEARTGGSSEEGQLNVFGMATEDWGQLSLEAMIDLTRSYFPDHW